MISFMIIKVDEDLMGFHISKLQYHHTIAFLNLVVIPIRIKQNFGVIRI